MQVEGKALQCDGRTTTRRGLKLLASVIRYARASRQVQFAGRMLCVGCLG